MKLTGTTTETTSVSARTPLTGVALVLADLDGVIYRGPDAIPYAVESMNAIDGPQVAYITNNASRTDASVAEHLSELGLTVEPRDVVTSPQAAMGLLRAIVPAGSTIMVVGGDGLTNELEKSGFVVTRSADDSPAAVVQGFAPHVGWKDLAEASFALKGGDSGIPWIATNTDWTIPQARGTAPGNGTLVSAVHSAVGRLPIVAGKPEVAIFEEAFARYESREALMIGDRLDTDILGANRAGIPSLLVLTGIDQAKQVLACIPDERPTMIVDDLRGLHEPYPETIVTQDGAAVMTTVGTATVRLEGQRLTVTSAGTSIDRLRAGAAAIWNSGSAIYALEVPAELYS
ncbi:HAD-IIA family hydrolase [Salinibacterium sp. NG22]|uniref:HAD-IIA family hydrolase n=1 Tax=Salinibacterium sp. NG22 TaxID=2792040 RepID=UPI0018CD55EC|nr:HAD-IIA family hydrolase [Salinibacterium sp. NG22]MBH0108547.1 HAD-IIA family hydrolase [Salinibacterium sp. NG22]